MPKLDSKSKSILDFLEWAVDNQELEFHSEHSKPFSTEVDLPAGWGSGSGEIVGVKIYYRANKVSRTYMKELLNDWSNS
jgi:hypothetical protein